MAPDSNPALDLFISETAVAFPHAADSNECFLQNLQAQRSCTHQRRDICRLFAADAESCGRPALKAGNQDRRM